MAHEVLTSPRLSISYLKFWNDGSHCFVDIRNNYKYAFLWCLVTRVDMCNKGYAKALLEEVKQYLKDNGVPILRLTASPWDHKTMDFDTLCEFYKKCGGIIHSFNQVYFPLEVSHV